MTPSDLKFGTSGLRGLASELDGEPAFTYALAFALVLLSRGEITAGGRVLIGQDLRPSSPSIARRCAAGLQAAGIEPIDCGLLPTPALAARALAESVPAIMVTGSHIPEDRNGLKFYRRDGEIDKNDEAAIAAEAAAARETRQPPASRPMAADGGALDAYRQRALGMLPPGALAGLRVGVYQHSTVGRDLFVSVLEGLGAVTLALGRSDVFVPVDTEALRAEDEALALRWASEQALDAIVSADGDADRPLIADERGRFLRGDLVGAVTADALRADCVVTPVSSNSGIERSGRFPRVLRTRIGSPYVIAGMKQAAAEGARVVIGFEANGGVLLGSRAELAGRSIAALPTRDALLPILAVLWSARSSGKPLSALGASFAFSQAASDRLKDIEPDRSASFLSLLREDAGFRRDFCAGALDAATVDLTDGVRISSADGSVLHYRASGNAPELRCYVEAPDEAAARVLLANGLRKASAYLAKGKVV